MPWNRTVIALACTGTLLAQVAVQAHAHLDHAQPAVGSTVKTAPTEVTLWFTEAVEPKFSSVEVRDATGAAVQSGAAQGVPDNTVELRVTVKPLKAGRYTVKWRALSVDTHHTQGDFTFTVAP